MTATDLDAPAPLPAMRFDLPADPTGASFRAYAQNSAPTVAISLPEGADPGAFTVAAAVWQLPHAILSRISSTAQLHRRTQEQIAADPTPMIMMQTLEAGSVSGAMAARAFSVVPGDVWFLDLARPYESTVQPFTVLTAMVARTRVPPALLAPGTHGLRFSADSSAAGMLRSALTALVDGLATATAAEAEVGLSALCLLAAGLVEAHLSAARAARRRVGPGTDWLDPVRAAAEDCIVERVRDTTFKPSDLARHLGVSRASLYRLFEAEGGVEAVVYARRLDLVVRRLLLEVGPLPPMRVLAAESGFASAGRLQRAFEGRFGTTPVQFRQKVEGRDLGWLSEQARRAGFATHELWIAALAPWADGMDTIAAGP